MNTPHQLVFFGDSCIDTGRMDRLTRAAIAAGKAPQEASVLPHPDFFWNGHWSNGKMYPEFLAEAMHAPLLNYAVGGAKTGHGNYHGWLDAFYDTGVLAQAEDYVHEHGGKADPDALYFIMAGWNDETLLTYRKDLPIEERRNLDIADKPEALADAARVAEQAGRNIAAVVKRLSESGARKIAVQKMVFAPGLIHMNPNALFSRFLQNCNEAIWRSVSEAEKETGVRVLFIDETKQMEAIAEDPGAYGFDSVDVPYLTAYDDAFGNHHYTRNAAYSPDALYCWDDHYTTKAQKLTADFMLPLLQQYFEEED